MSLEGFRELCNKGKFYWFITLDDFDKGVDYNGVNLKKKGVKFNNGVEDMYKEHGYDIMRNACPTRYMSYGILSK